MLWDRLGVGPSNDQGLGLIRQTFYGFQVTVVNAASYVRTQLDDWQGHSGLMVASVIVCRGVWTFGGKWNMEAD